MDVQPTCYPSLYFGDCGFVEPSVTLPKYKFSLAKGRRPFSQESIDCIDCVIADLYVLSLGGVLEMIPVILFAAMCLSGLTTLCYWGEWANRELFNQKIDLTLQKKANDSLFIFLLIAMLSLVSIWR